MSDDEPESHDGDLSVLVGMAEDALKRRHLQDAIALCRGVLSRAAGNAPARHILGSALLGLGRATEAASLLADLAAEHPGRLDYRTLLARAMVACGRPDEAISQLEHVVGQFPLAKAQGEQAEDEAWLELATAYLAKTAATGDIPAYRRCCQAYKRAYALTSNKRDLMVTMAERFVEKGYYFEAEEALGYALLHAAGDRQVMAFMARIAQWRRDSKRANSIW
jgi:predicted Zn-dependent protease